MKEQMNPLAEAFVAEAMEAAKDRMRALKAKQEGKTTEAKLFTALADARDVHTARALMLLRGKTASTPENLELSEQVTKSLAQALYPAMLDTLRETDDTAHASVALHFMKTAMNHAGRIRMVEKSAGEYSVCTVCGFIADGPIPEECPVCHAVPKKFSAVEAP